MWRRTITAVPCVYACGIKLPTRALHAPSMYSSTPSPACICRGSHPSDEQIVGMYFAQSQSFRMEDSIAAGRHPILDGQLTSLWGYPMTRLGNPKVPQHQPAVSQQENVLRLEVPVENQAAVHVVQA